MALFLLIIRFVRAVLFIFLFTGGFVRGFAGYRIAAQSSENAGSDGLAFVRKLPGHPIVDQMEGYRGSNRCRIVFNVFQEQFKGFVIPLL